MLRVVFLLVFVVVLASCPMTPEPDTPKPTAEAGEDRADIIEGVSVTLAGSGTPESASFSWEQINIAEGQRPVYIREPDSASTSFKAPFVPGVPGDEPLTLEFELTVASGGGSSTDTVHITVKPSPDVDADRDGLIEIDTLAMLHNMRYNLAGTSYDTDASDSTGNPGSGTGDTGLIGGCPGSVCNGYELTQNLDFDTDGDGTWSGEGTTASPFVLDMDDNNDDYFDVDAGGWAPIGMAGFGNGFTGIFDGNGYTISNMAIRRSDPHVGLFGQIDVGAVIRNIGLVDSLADSTCTALTCITGTLLGRIKIGSVIASYSKNGIAYRGDTGESPATGVLIGDMDDDNSLVVASYATGIARGGQGTGNSPVGILVGRQQSNIIRASYATGTAIHGDGDMGEVGILIGAIDAASFIGSSYSDGMADGGGGTNDKVGVLVGDNTTATIANSYGFGMTSGGETTSSDGTTYPSGVTAAAGLTAANAGTTDSGAPAWNDAASHTLGAWDFGTADQAPALKYADYDGPDGSTYSCDMFPEGLCNTIIPGQGR